MSAWPREQHHGVPIHDGPARAEPAGRGAEYVGAKVPATARQRKTPASLGLDQTEPRRVRAAWRGPTTAAAGPRGGARHLLPMRPTRGSPPVPRRPASLAIDCRNDWSIGTEVRGVREVAPSEPARSANTLQEAFACTARGIRRRLEAACSSTDPRRESQMKATDMSEAALARLPRLQGRARSGAGGGPSESVASDHAKLEVRTTIEEEIFFSVPRQRGHQEGRRHDARSLRGAPRRSSCSRKSRGSTHDERFAAKVTVLKEIIDTTSRKSRTRCSRWPRRSSAPEALTELAARMQHG
jgi:hypothetical protein